MKRRQAPQISNATWYPSFLRRDMYEFMSWFVGKVNAATPFVPVIEEGLQHTTRILAVDLNFGAGFETVRNLLPANLESHSIPLKDIETAGEGMVLFVNNFHQLPVPAAKAALQKATQAGQVVGVVEGNNDSLWQVVGMLVFVPLTVVLTAPLVRPFRWTRLLFTYLLPILPLVTLFDGFMALFKLYNPQDLDELVADIAQPTYTWRSGKRDNGRGGKIIYLLGYPKSQA